MQSKEYEPNQTNKQILDISMMHIKSVDYPVSLRWVFYRLLQEGIYKGKEGYGQFKSLTAMARKRFYNEWNPETLKDDTRNINWLGVGAFDKNSWITDLECHLDKFQTQDYFIIICFEARAMSPQFYHHTENIPLVPFGGDPSIPYKFSIAQGIEWASKHYNKPVIVLYFGDADKKGELIKSSAFKDIASWCEVDFELIHCGLTLSQAKAFNLPENPDKPGQYQWESLSDIQAKEIIYKNIEPYQDSSKFEEIEELEQEILSEIKEKVLDGGVSG